MTRPHDMGGRFGDGPVTPEPEDVKFHADWHPRALALTLAAGALGQWSIDHSRAAREDLARADYARFSYYEKWIAALADLLVAQGVVSRQELEHGTGSKSPLSDRHMRPGEVRPKFKAGSPVNREVTTRPRFQPGDRVRTLPAPANGHVPGGHTRLPGYAAGAVGQVLRAHGAHVLPDSNAYGLGENPEALYAVVFPAAALWDAPEHPGDEVVIDLWDSYLEPAE